MTAKFGRIPSFSAEVDSPTSTQTVKCDVSDAAAARKEPEVSQKVTAAHLTSGAAPKAQQESEQLASLNNSVHQVRFYFDEVVPRHLIVKKYVYPVIAGQQD